ncbi:MAG: COG1361 family protein [Nitrososphaerales archaeon]
MRSRRFTFLVIVILFLLAAPIVIGALDRGNLAGFGNSSHVLSASGSNPNYTENLAVYLTSSESFWRSDFSGGNISVSSLTVPASVSSYSITLTHYNTWKPQYELFTTYGFGLLGSNEPSPDGAFLQINTTSQGDAQTLANSLSQRFALVFELVSQNSGTFTFFSPLDFLTEMHVFFWNLVPANYGGFAGLMTEQQFEGNSLLYYKLSYLSSVYSVSIGALAPLSSSQFSLFNQIGLSSAQYNYSKYASSSTIEIHVLGGLITNASVPFVNNYANLSSAMTTNSQTGNGTIPNLNATLNLSFPTLVAYRQISPSLTPAQNSNVTVTIFVRNVSPTSAPVATDVKVNDSWVRSETSNLNLTNGQISSTENLTSNGLMTVAYSLRVLASNGTINIPATPVTYQFMSGNKTINSQAPLNPETLVIGGQNTPQLEATATATSGSIQAGQSFSVNVTIANKGSGTAFNIKSAGLTKQDIPAGGTWSFITNSSSTSLTQTNSSVSYPVTWSDSSGSPHTTSTNTFSTVFSFSIPDTPGIGIRKIVTLANSGVANVTLSLYDGSPNAVSNISISDPLPPGVTLAKSYNTSSLRASGSNSVVGNVTLLAGNANTTLEYQVNFTNPTQNYVFMPATVSAVWNNVTVTHSSSGYGLPLGVVASKTTNPSQGFQGSNVTVSIGLTNQGTLPVYMVSLNNTFDTFINETRLGSSYQQILNPAGTMNASTQGNLSGSQGVFNSSSAVASFIFAGSNNSVLSKPSHVTVYQLVQANFSSSALKYEENHNINITVAINNPSNVTVSNVQFVMSIPQGLNIVSNGQPNYTISSLGPGQTVYNSIDVITNQPSEYLFNSSNANLHFTYQGHVLKGTVSSLSLTLQDDLTLRYVIPILVALVIVLATLFYVRRLQKSK